MASTPEGLRPQDNLAAHPQLELQPTLTPRERTITAIHEQRQQLANTVRDYSRQQAPLWNLVPSLTLEAEGRSGYQDSAQWVVHRRAFPISFTGERHFFAYVDLNSGDIVDYPYMLDPIYGSEGAEIDVNNDETRRQKLASDEKVVRLASHLDTLDAVGLVEYLADAAQKPHWEGYNVQEVESWRDGIRRETGIDKPDFAKVKKTLDAYKQETDAATKR